MTPTEQDKELRIEIWDAIRYNKFNMETSSAVEHIMQLITADRKRVALEAEIAQLKSVVAGYEIYSHDATQFYKSIVKALLNKDERFYREYGEHALCQTDIDHLKAQQEEV